MRKKRRIALNAVPWAEVLVDGASALLSRPELSDVQRVRRMFETFADKARLVRMLNRCLEGGGMRVLIGGDSDLTSELDFSLVACPYGAGCSHPATELASPAECASRERTRRGDQ